MTAVPPALPPPLPLPGTARLLRIELRRNAMKLMLPLLAVAFWVDAYHLAIADPAVWSQRASELPNHLLRDYAAFAAGVAAWMAGRERRRHTAGQLNATAWPVWGRRLVTWVATTFWLLLAYLGCVAVLYGVTAAQATWGGPPWWPVAVCGAALAAVSAIGFGVGVLLPGRLTAPLVMVATLLLSVAIRSTSPYALLWPTTDASGTNTGGLPLAPPDAGLFYHYLPDLSIAQVMFMAGITVAGLGLLGLTSNTGRALRGTVAVVTVAGLAAAGTAAGLAGTARQGGYGVVIPALHDAASDRPIPYTPVCARVAGVPVCLHPAFGMYLTDVATAVAPVLREVTGLPGAPVRLSQIPVNALTPADAVITANPPVYRFTMPGFPPGAAGLTQLTEDVQETFIINFLNDGRLLPSGTRLAASIEAQEAVEWVLLQPFDPQAELDIATQGNSSSASPAVAAAARRLAALTPAARHAWLAVHLPALRAGHLTLEELP